MSTEQISNYWLDVAVREIIAKYPEGDIVVSSGISPSASYHIGHFREILTADALTWGLQQAGRNAIHKHVVDNFDPLRKRYSFLPEGFEQYVGWPICLVPDPFGECHESYADHFYKEFEKYAQQMGVYPEEVVRGYEDLYLAGKMTKAIENCVDRVDLIKKTFAELSNRTVAEDWLPLQLLSKNNSFAELGFKSIDMESKTIVGVDEAGEEQVLHYDKGQVKLNWRLDWPARWEVLGVQVEPFSAQEHGAAGSSYDTGVRFSQDIFDYPAPIPGVRYGNIHLVGENTKMSSSKGNLITPEQALDIMPAESLRYFVVRSRPDRTLVFDPGLGFYNQVDEFSKVEEAVEKGEDHEFADAYKFAKAGKEEKAVAAIPFSHLVSVYQTAQGDEGQILTLLARTGYEAVVAEQKDVLLREIPYVKNWLAKYAPESVKFEVQKELPKVELDEGQSKFVSLLADDIEAAGELDGPAMHQAIYAAKEAADIKPNEAFQALYRLILGKDSGPKAGYFLSSLDRDWLIKRLRQEP